MFMGHANWAPYLKNESICPPGVEAFNCSASVFQIRMPCCVREFFFNSAHFISKSFIYISVGAWLFYCLFLMVFISVEFLKLCNLVNICWLS